MFFGYNGVDKRVIYGVLILLCVLSLASMSAGAWLNILLTLPAVILAISFHEFAHAFVADRFGDTTPRSQGRLTLNPIKHLDFFGFILMLFAHIGWGKPVQINPNNFNSNKSRGYCESMVALAGPMANFILAILSTVAYVFMQMYMPQTGTVFVLLNFFVQIFITVNIGLGVFNLIPLPPLDGEKIFRNLLPYKAQEWLTRNYQTLYMIFMILWFFGFLEIIVNPVISTISTGLTYGVSHIILFIMGLF